MTQLQLRLRVLRSLFWLMLIASTWRMWFPESGTDAFPVIPFFGGLTRVPFAIDHCLSMLLVAALLCDAVMASLMMRTSRLASGLCRLNSAWIGIIGSAVALVALDQQRLQPWTYHLILLTPILAIDWSETHINRSDGKWIGWSSMTLVVLLTASIYFWSAISKLDVSFAREHGRVFVDALVEAVGLSTRFWSPTARLVVPLTLPLIELLIGIGLLFRPIRRRVLFLAVGMHGVLILAVGPWGINQRVGVTLWNLLFMTQNLVLASGLKRTATDAEQRKMSVGNDQAAWATASTDWRRMLVTGITCAAVVAPILRTLNGFDLWPSWSVYSASHRRVSIEWPAYSYPHRRMSTEMESFGDEKLPEWAQHFHMSIVPGVGRLRIDHWALDSYNAPIYPQDRFQIAVALALTKRYPRLRYMNVRITEEADRWTGRRRQWSVSGEALPQHADQFWLNMTERHP